MLVILSVVGEMMTYDELNTYEKLQYDAYLCAAPVFYGLGYLGCIFNLITLSNHQKFRSRIYTYLRALSLADICYITFIIPLYAFRVQDSLGTSDKDDKSAMKYHIFAEIPLANGFSAASVFIVLCMTVDRYYAICQPIAYQKSRKNRNPRINVILCFVVGLLLQLPEVFCVQMVTELCTYLHHCAHLNDLNIEYQCPCLCLNETINANDTKFPPIQPLLVINHTQMDLRGTRVCSISGQTMGFQSGNQTMLVTDTHVWMAYKIICELITRFGPTLLLVILNVAIIRNFNLSVQRKKKLRANHFIQRSASKLMDRPSKFFAPGRKKLSSVTSEVFTIDSGFQDQRKSASFSFNPIEERRRVSLSAAANGVVATGKEDECKGANGANQKTNLRKRRMSINHYKKEKSVVVILVLVSIMFAFATIPSGIVRILAIEYSDNSDHPGYEMFKVVANMLELANASINFYMYCLCNKEIRSQAAKILCSTVRLWKSEVSSHAVPETSNQKK